MRVYVPINGNKKFRTLCHDYPDRLGYIISPSYYLKPRPNIPFVLDNDAFGCWKRGTEFDQKAWFKMLSKVAINGQSPEWTIIPDVVCDRDGTLKNWEIYEKHVDGPRAFVLQDGMAIGDVPKADIYFVGGSDGFKWTTAHYWCSKLPRVHVGRVRSKKLHHCEKIGAESCDGSGWMRETVNGRPYRQLEAWVMNCNHQYDLPINQVETVR